MGDQKQGVQSRSGRAVYVQVDEIETSPVEGCARTLRRKLLRSEYLEVDQTIIEGSGAAEDHGDALRDRLYYVLDGEARLRLAGAETEILPGHLLVVPRGASCAEGVSVRSDALTLLEIARRVDEADEDGSTGASGAGSIRVIRPEDAVPYEPAGHAKTLNRCLFQDDQLEVIEGSIEAGGGAEEHHHDHNEQMLYVLEGSDRPLLIHYPRGTTHGTGGGISNPLKLLVVYAPPLGEARGALR